MSGSGDVALNPGGKLADSGVDTWQVGSSTARAPTHDAH